MISDGVNQYKHKHSVGSLWVLVFLAIAVGTLFHYWTRLTGINELDGLIGVWLGLYICSRPAANFLEIIVFHGDIRMWDSLRQSAVSWLALNMLVLLAGFILIMIGTTRFFSGW